MCHLGGRRRSQADTHAAEEPRQAQGLSARHPGRDGRTTPCNEEARGQKHAPHACSHLALSPSATSSGACSGWVPSLLQQLLLSWRKRMIQSLSSSLFAYLVHPGKYDEKKGDA